VELLIVCHHFVIPTSVKKRLLLLAFLPVSFALSEEVAVPDTAVNQWNPLVSEQLPSDSYWSLSSNPATLSFLTQPVSNLSFEMKGQEGAYRKRSDPRSIRSEQIASEGYQKEGPFTFYGSFDYHLSTEKARKWHNVLLLTEENPFIFADSIAGDFGTESFLLKGRIASFFSDERFAWGAEISYLAGNSADQTDPRTLMNGTRYSLKPGFVFRNKNWMYGLNLKEERYGESISMTVVDETEVNHYFLFMGLSVYYPASGNSYSRRYEGNNFSVEAQVHRFGKENDLFFQAGWETIKETSQDGSASNQFKGGDYTANNFSFLGVGCLDKNQKNTHLIQLTGGYRSAKGLWYDQQKTTDSNGDTYWSVYSQSIRYREQAVHAGAEYTFIHRQGSVHEGKAGVTAQLEQDKTNSYPDGYFIKYTNVEIGLNGSKSTPVSSKDVFSGGIECRYRYNLSQQSNTSGIKLESMLTKPNFQYVTADRISGNAFLQFGRELRKKNNHILYGFLKAAVDSNIPLNNSYYADCGRTITTLTLGFIF
jgi:hypothetical protein